MYKTELALQKVYNSPVPSAEDIKYLLSITDETEINTIFDFANRVRREYMGEGILLRGIVEFSNFCSKSCTYCGLSSSNSKLERYTLSKDQILVSAAQMASSGIKTIVLQSGESNEIGLKPLIEAIKENNTQKIASLLNNTLEAAILNDYPVIKDIKAHLIKKGCLNAVMSGSGPSVFAICDKSIDLSELKKVYDEVYEVSIVSHGACNIALRTNINAGTFLSSKTFTDSTYANSPKCRNNEK